MESSAEDSASFQSLPLEERLGHSLWKARQHAYNELETRFKSASIVRYQESGVDKFWRRPELFAGYVTDSNVVAQESGVKALAVLLKFMPEVQGIRDLCQPAQLVQEWVPALVEKGATASKAVTREVALECVLGVVSLDDNIVNAINAIAPLWSKKLPKLLTAALLAAAKLIEQYGFINMSQHDKMQVLQTLVDVLAKLCSHADKSVRNESMQLILQLYVWFDKPVLQDLLLTKLKPIQQKDLDKLFDTYQGNIPPSSTPSQFVWAAPVPDDLRNIDGDTNMGQTDELGSNVAMESGYAVNDDIDPYVMLPVQTILDKLPPKFSQNLASSVWKERVEALEALHDQTLTKIKKLSNSEEDYSDLIHKFCNTITSDANLQAVQLATNSLDILICALRSDFKSYAAEALNALLTRSKEKKPNVADAIFKALLDLSTYYGLESCLESVLDHMKNKVPQVKVVCSKFLFELLSKWSPSQSPQRTAVFSSLPAILTSLQPIVNDNQQATRNEGFKCIAILVKIFNERELSTYLEKLDSLKRRKILDLVDTIEIRAVQRPSENLGSNQNRGLLQKSAQQNIPSRPSSHLPSGSSTIPSKRLATSPLKPSRNANLNGATKSSRLTSRSLTTSQLQSPQLQHSQQNSVSYGSSVSSQQASLSTRMSHLNDEVNKLRQERQEWLKERSDLLSNLNQSKLQVSKLNKQVNDTELTVSDLQRQLHDMQLRLHERDSRIKELESRNSSTDNPPADRPSYSPSLNRGRLTSTTLSPLRSSKNLTPQRIRSPSESSDDLPRRVNSLNLNNHMLQEESWKRAAEVTNQLKARIERMRAKSRSGFADPGAEKL